MVVESDDLMPGGTNPVAHVPAHPAETDEAELHVVPPRCAFQLASVSAGYPDRHDQIAVTRHDFAVFTGEALTIGFNPQYLIDGLQNLGAPTAMLSFVDAFKPAVISPAGENGEIVPGYRYLIMPIRVTR